MSRVQTTKLEPAHDRDMPISDLNDDALLHILEFIAQEDENGAFLIISVCSRWMSLALDTPSVWRYITIADRIEDWDSRLAISTTLAREMPLVVKAFFPVNADRLSRLFEQQIHQLKVYTLPIIGFDLKSSFLSLQNVLRLHPRDTIRRVTWYGDKEYPQFVPIPLLYPILEQHVKENHIQAFTTAVEECPSILLSHFSVNESTSSRLSAEVLMNCLHSMAHLTSLAIEDTLTWSTAQTSPIWTLPLLEQLDYSFPPDSTILQPRLRLRVPRLSRLCLTGEYRHIPSILSNLTGFLELELLSLKLFSISTASVPKVYRVQIGPIWSLMIDITDITQTERGDLHYFTYHVAGMFQEAWVNRWKAVMRSSALNYSDPIHIPLNEVSIIHSPQDHERLLPLPPKAVRDHIPISNFVSDALTITADSVVDVELLRRLPVARKCVISSSNHAEATVGDQFTEQFASHVQDIYISPAIRRNQTLEGGRHIHYHTFSSLVRLSAPIDIVYGFFFPHYMPALEELIFLSHSSQTLATKDITLVMIIRLFLRGRRGTDLARLHTIGFDWWPRWDIIKALIKSWNRLPKETTNERLFTLKLPGRPHPCVLETLVDLLNGLPPRYPLPDVDERVFGEREETYWSHIRKGFHPFSTADPSSDAPASAPSFAVTKDTFVGEYEM
ncbi:SubName: Full=Uncharacterized protein {ECO:0000313/EMBL:CCA73705.1} [Serendipita indica DSM 11827]|uniref:F-box domain-containing protein n=1 Tax=Serendipita indica (strain DSM 11827) TaxID=1109443 RepID=G4TQW2_SERID|nr:SubName: Full=Uncharacterized protein {ECO:0000313/EMBL:CCA73705.1} [Serendipita indica DSM 11827]CCA73705.1 hypothetical protein PIIN_07659 [Serendipita indica DSM 11827]